MKIHFRCSFSRDESDISESLFLVIRFFLCNKINGAFLEVCSIQSKRCWATIFMKGSYSHPGYGIRTLSVGAISIVGKNHEYRTCSVSFVTWLPFSRQVNPFFRTPNISGKYWSSATRVWWCGHVDMRIRKWNINVSSGGIEANRWRFLSAGS